MRVRQKEVKWEDDKNKTEPLAQATVAHTVARTALAIDLGSSNMPINIDLSRENGSLSNQPSNSLFATFSELKGRICLDNGLQRKTGSALAFVLRNACFWVYHSQVEFYSI